MSVKLSSLQVNLLEQIVKENGFKDYDLKTKAASIKGDNYMGVLNTIDVIDRDNPKKNLHLILKSALENEKIRQSAPIRKAYQRETFIYGTIFPEMNRVETESGVENQFGEFPKYYGSSLEEGQECLILENLKAADFELWDRMTTMNEEHASLTFKTYGKLHAGSLLMKTLVPEKFDELTKDLTNIFVVGGPEGEKIMQEFLKPMFASGFAAVAGNEVGTKLLQKFMGKVGGFLKSLETDPSPYRCILHGDCWCNNMLYKYDNGDKTKPKEMRLLDWQLSSIDSPVLDLYYYLFASCGPEVWKNQEKLLKIYHNAISETLSEAGCNPEEVFPLSALKQEWEKYRLNGLFMALFVIKLVVSKSEEAVDLEKMAESGVNILQSLSDGKSNLDLAYKRISDVIMFYAENNLV